MILYDYDSNSILTEPMKSQTDDKIIQSYQALHNRLIAAGLNLDYKSWTMKPLIASNNFSTPMTLNSNLYRLTRTTAMPPNERSEPSRITSLLASVAPTSCFPLISGVTLSAKPKSRSTCYVPHALTHVSLLTRNSVELSTTTQLR